VVRSQYIHLMLFTICESALSPLFLLSIVMLLFLLPHPTPADIDNLTASDPALVGRTTPNPRCTVCSWVISPPTNVQ
jgi:hypothetical protein